MILTATVKLQFQFCLISPAIMTFFAWLAHGMSFGVLPFSIRAETQRLGEMRKHRAVSQLNSILSTLQNHHHFPARFEMEARGIIYRCLCGAIFHGVLRLVSDMAEFVISAIEFVMAPFVTAMFPEL